MRAEREFRAQIDRALALGVRIDYVDCHMGMACREDLIPVTRKLAKEYCLGVSSVGMFGEQRLSAKGATNTPAAFTTALVTELEGLTPGLFLYVDHPAVDTPELRAVDTESGERWGGHSQLSPRGLDRSSRSSSDRKAQDRARAHAGSV